MEICPILKLSVEFLYQCLFADFCTITVGEQVRTLFNVFFHIDIYIYAEEMCIEYV